MSDRIPLTLTKLQPPQPTANLVWRPSLLGRMADALHYRATIVCAGAGYGKTTLLASLPAASSGQSATLSWYTLGPTDRDIGVFLLHLIEAICDETKISRETLIPLIYQSPDLSGDCEYILSTLIRELVQIQSVPHLVVLDDFHSVDDSPPVNRAVDYLLRYLPAGIHLVIASRSRPALPSLPKLRLTGKILVFDENDLRFTPTETDGLFRAHGVRVDPASVCEFTKQTEGWTIALQLVAQSLSANSGLSTIPEVERELLFEYLAAEVLHQLPAEVQLFLRDSAALPTLDPALCDAVLDRTDSATQIELLTKRSLFVVPLESGSFRYHHLFRDFLLSEGQREPGRYRRVLRRAAEYFEERGHLETAVECELDAEEFAGAVRLIGVLAPALMRSDRFHQLSTWLARLPHWMVEQDPHLLFYQGWVDEQLGRLDQAIECYARAETGYLEQQNWSGLGRVLLRRGYLLAWRRGQRAEAEKLYRAALQHASKGSGVDRAVLLTGLALDQLVAARPSAALRLYHQAVSLYEADGDTEGLLNVLVGVGFWLYSVQGEFTVVSTVIEISPVAATRSPQGWS